MGPERRPAGGGLPLVRTGFAGRALQIGAPGAAPAENAAVDAEGQVRRRYGPGTIHLIRPDGHLAATGRSAIEAYLDRVYPG